MLKFPATPISSLVLVLVIGANLASVCLFLEDGFGEVLRGNCNRINDPPHFESCTIYNIGAKQGEKSFLA
jgi:hypothetical protein